MARIEGKFKEVLDKTEFVAIATSSADGPHIAATWGDYVRTIGLQDNDETIVIPAGRYRKTEENLAKNNRVEVLIASKQVQGTRSPGQGCRISGTGEVQTAGPLAELAKAKFPWARGALVIRVESLETQL